ncbi:MAG: hypothetical protein KDE27_11040 [Planctomycetes bacterium]|nr:hypothetical protein [Planctomycetota bacterium]
MKPLQLPVAGALLAAGAGLVFAATASGQGLDTWIAVPTAVAPGPRGWGEAAFDAVRDRFVLFGGVLQSAAMSDTWEFDGREWSLRPTANAPSPRWAHRLAHDFVRQRVVLFGGRDTNGFFDDTWEWDGVAWTQRSPATVPVRRGWHQLVYDTLRGLTVMIGGSNDNVLSTSTVLVWNGTDWTDLSPPPGSSPFPLTDHGAAYDLVRDRVVVHGGYDGTALRGDTWEWDQTSWTLVAASGPATPGALDVPAMTYDLALGRTVLFSGYRAGFNSDTWAWDGAAWQQQAPISAPPQPAGLTPTLTAKFDVVRGRVLLAVSEGGGDVSTWAFGRAPYVEFGHGCPGAGGTPSLAACPGSSPRLGTTFCAAIDDLPATNDPVFMAFATRVASPWIDLTGLGLPGCLQFLPNGFGVQWLVRSTPTRADWVLPIPNNTAFLGVRFANQAIAYDPTVSSALPLTVSNGGLAEIGP